MHICLHILKCHLVKDLEKSVLVIYSSIFGPNKSLLKGVRENKLNKLHEQFKLLSKKITQVVSVTTLGHLIMLKENLGHLHGSVS